MSLSQYDKDMCRLYLASNSTRIFCTAFDDADRSEFNKSYDALADKGLVRHAKEGGYAITVKGLLVLKVWRIHLLFHHPWEYKYFRRKK